MQTTLIYFPFGDEDKLTHPPRIREYKNDYPSPWHQNKVENRLVL